MQQLRSEGDEKPAHVTSCTLLEAAEGAFLAGQFPKVKQCCEEILSLDRHHVQALHLMRLIANRDVDIDSEMDLLTRILEVAPDHVESLNGLGDAMRKQGRVTEAVEPCLRAIRLRPGYANAHNTLGLCYAELGRHLDAAECFERAISFQPGLAAAHLNLGRCLQKLKRDPEAVGCYRRAISLSPNSSEAFEALGMLMTQMRKRSEAVQCYRRVLELNPKSPRAHLLLADSLEQQGSPREAAKLIHRALDLNPNSGAAYCFLGFALLDTGEFRQGMEAFEKSISLRPAQGDAYIGWVTSKKIKADDRPFLNRMKEQLKKPDTSMNDRVRIHFALGKAYDDLGEFELAIRHTDEGNRIALASEGDTRAAEAEMQAYLEKSIKTFTRDFFSEHNKLGRDDELPLFIVGLPRSGTTLLEQILSSHSLVSAGGEIPYWDDQRASNLDGLVGLASHSLDAVAAAKNYLRFLREIGGSARLVTDKYNDNVRALGFLHLLFPKARIIHCRRNPLDNCISMYLTPFREKSSSFRTRAGIVAYFRNNERLMSHWRNVIPASRLMDVDYEEVVADRESVARRIIEFCGLEWEDACLRHEDNERVVITPSKWQARQPIYTTSVERWRRYEPWLGEFRELLPESVSR